VTTIWSGLSVGAIYVLIAVGYNLVYSTAGVFNFAQAQLVVVSTFLAYFGYHTLHINAALIVLMSGAICLLIGVIEWESAVRPLGGKGSHRELLTTVGFAVMLEGAVSIIWGENPLEVPFFGPNQPLTVTGGRVLPVELITVGLAIVVAIGLHLWLRTTKLGLACLATSEDRVAARLRGIKVSNLSRGAFGAAGCLAGLTGVFVGPQTFAVPELGNFLGVAGFIAFVVGGGGSQLGALLGGLATGIVGAEVSRWLGSQYSNSVIFVFLLALLMLRPTGLLGTLKETRV
jgi:branched-chain amino acid transport system permease protein